MGDAVTLRDVAAHAGVSIKSVSNVVNGYPFISAAMRQRVEHALVELNYRPNIAARQLRSARTGLIALAIPEVAVPYFGELARSVITVAADHGWTVLIDQTGGDRQRELMVVQGIRDHLIDGLIFSPLALGEIDIASRVDGTPMVLLGERVSGGPIDHVVIDNVAAAQSATAHLIGLGRRRVAAIGAQRKASAQTARLRLEGYRRAMKRAGLAAPRERIVHVAQYHRAEGAQAMTHLLTLPEPPDAVICFNDLLALGAIRALHEAGMRVPDDIAIIGIDDIEEGRFSVPTLSTIAPDKAAIARLAVDKLAARISGEADRPSHDTAPGFSLVARESTLG